MTCVVTSALLWIVFPSPAFLGLAVGLVVIANIGFEFGVVFNNANADLTPQSRLGRLSGWAWGLGYAGGLAALLLALLVLSEPGAASFGLDRQTAEEVRIIGPLVAIWLLVFSTPLFLFGRVRPSPCGGAKRLGRYEADFRGSAEAP
jgi:UMF1 family MFS transporter